MGQRDLKCLMITGPWLSSTGPSGATRRPLAGQGGPWLRDPEIMDKATHPPPRCKEGTLVEVMQHRWCSPISDGILAR